MPLFEPEEFFDELEPLPEPVLRLLVLPLFPPVGVGLGEVCFDGVALFVSGVGSAVPKVLGLAPSSVSPSRVSVVLLPDAVLTWVSSSLRLLTRNGTDSRSAPAMAAAASMARGGRPGWPFCALAAPPSEPPPTVTVSGTATAVAAPVPSGLSPSDCAPGADRGCDSGSGCASESGCVSDSGSGEDAGPAAGSAVSGATAVGAGAVAVGSGTGAVAPETGSPAADCPWGRSVRRS